MDAKKCPLAATNDLREAEGSPRTFYEEVNG